MTTGVYKLSFNNTDEVYIGQSINIEKRFLTHINELKNNTHVIKLQEAYVKYGLPTLSILSVGNIDMLDNTEEYYIKKYNSVLNGFNSASKASGGVSLGENNGLSKYSNNQIIEAVELMVDFPDISLKVLSDNIDISWDTLKQIARGAQYRWLSTTIPDTYTKLLELKGTRKSTSNSAKGKGIFYPQVVSPEGITYTIDNCSKFAAEHGLQQSNLHQLLLGSRKSHKGWRKAQG